MRDEPCKQSFRLGHTFHDGSLLDGRPISAAYSDFYEFGSEATVGLYDEPPSKLEKALDAAMHDVSAAIFGTAYVAACAAAAVMNPECLLKIVDAVD